MAHVMKYTKVSYGHMLKHYERAKDKNGEYVKFGNENIDLERTPLNYNLAPDRGSQGEFIRNRCSEVYCMNRKDVNVLCSWVVTVPKDVPEAEYEKFFHATYDFLEKRYGRENVVSAYVHMDEITPHMHFAFVPVVYDKKKERYKVSAFEVINRKELKIFHSELEKHLENALGHQVGILNNATIEGNKSIEELKRQTAAERLREASTKASQIVSTAQNKVTELEQAIHALENRQTMLEGDIKALEVNLQGRQLQVQEVMEIRPRYETGFLGSVKGIKGVTVSDIENLKVTALKGLEAREKLERLTSEYTRVKALVPTLQMRKETAQDKMRLEQLERAFQRLPESLKKQLLSANDKTQDRER